MKKVFSICLVGLIIITSIFMVSCTPYNEGDNINLDIYVAVPDGAPALAIAKMMRDNSQFEGYNIHYNIITGGATEITAAVNSGQANILIAPTNLGSILYNKLKGSKDIKLIGNQFNSLLYLAGKDQNVTDLQQLKGKVVYVIGQGATPDLTFQYILNQSNIDFELTDEPAATVVGLQYVADASVLLPQLKQGLVQFAILGEPAVTKAIDQMGCYELFSLNELWNTVTQTTQGFPQASFFAIGDVLSSEHKALLDWFISKAIENVTWVEENPVLAQETLVASGWVTPIDLNFDLIQRCNMEFIPAQEAKPAINNYLNVLFSMNPVTVGGSIPLDDFYYENAA